jgi:hypothetical protein
MGRIRKYLVFNAAVVQVYLLKKSAALSQLSELRRWLRQVFEVPNIQLHFLQGRAYGVMKMEV